MRKSSWIAKGSTHHAVIVSSTRYVNLTATKSTFFVRLIGEEEEDIAYSSSAKNLNDAKRLAEAFGHSLLENSQEMQKNDAVLKSKTHNRKVDALHH